MCVCVCMHVNEQACACECECARYPALPGSVPCASPPAAFGISPAALFRSPAAKRREAEEGGRGRERERE